MNIIKIIGIFLLVILGLIIINVGITLIMIFIPILGFIILGGALVGLFLIIYKTFEGKKK